MLRTTLGKHTIKFVQIRKEIIYYPPSISLTHQHKKSKTTQLFTATHSMISTYLGNTTIVLKLPFTSALLTNGLQRYNGFPSVFPKTDGELPTGEGGWEDVVVWPGRP